MPDQSVAGYTEVTWAEDRATRGRDPSADPGAKTGVGGRTPPLGIPGIGRNGDKSSHIYFYQRMA